MIKPILTFSLAFFLCACASAPVKQLPPQVQNAKKVNFFAAGHTQAAFKVVGTMNGAALEGVLIAKKIGEEDVDVSVLTAGAYRVLHATVTPQAVAYRYLFKDADTAPVRGRISQFLNLLFVEPGTYQRMRVGRDELMTAYKGPSAVVHLRYKPQAVYPFAAKTITMLNTADLTYDQYAPADGEGAVLVPHELVYRDGKIALELTLIRLK